MLKTLHVSNFGVLGDVEADFPAGLVCLTGETGAGKSLLVDAIKLLLGSRADPADVRAGEREALVEAVFDVAAAPGLAEDLRAAGYEQEEGEVRLRRTVGADGRGKAWIQGRLATARELRDLGGRLVSVAGQHAFIGLGVPAERLAMLDAHAGLAADVARYAGRFEAYRAARNALDDLKAREAERLARQDYLEFVVRQIESLKPEPGEVERLAATILVMRGVARLKELSAVAADALYEGTPSAFDAVGRALAAAREMARIDPRVAPCAARLESIQIEAREASRELSDHADGLDDDPGRLAASEERIEALKSLARKFGGTVEGVMETLAASREELASLAGATEASGRLAAEADALRAEVDGLASRLSERRRAAARTMSKAVTRALRSLAMEGATLSVEVSRAELSESGADLVEFMVETNPGEGTGPVAEFASGGELSRITLALYSVVSAAVGTPVIVYDEIDAGLSGAVADRMGEVLAGAARGRQVFVVTHHGQIAARADAHCSIEKRTRNGRTVAQLSRLDDAGRLAEVARMLGGRTVTPRVMAHARELLGRTSDV
jgi:DNA repair protein RecN (Recombination protein N)